MQLPNNIKNQYMKGFLIITFNLFIIFGTNTSSVHAQAINWKWAEKNNHIVQANLGIDQGLVSGMGYMHRLPTRKPIFLNLHVSNPAGRKSFDDFKAQFGGQMVWFNRSKLKGSIGLQGIARRYENRLVRIYNFGSKLNTSFGYYTPKWFAAFNTSFDKAIVSHFKHSRAFTEHYYRNVKDGWYEPTMGGNIYFNLQTGYALNNFELTLELGRIWNEDFISTPTIPIYAMMGLNYRFIQSKKNSK